MHSQIMRESKQKFRVFIRLLIKNTTLVRHRFLKGRCAQISCQIPTPKGDDALKSIKVLFIIFLSKK